MPKTNTETPVLLKKKKSKTSVKEATASPIAQDAPKPKIISKAKEKQREDATPAAVISTEDAIKKAKKARKVDGEEQVREGALEGVKKGLKRKTQEGTQVEKEKKGKKNKSQEAREAGEDATEEPEPEKIKAVVEPAKAKKGKEEKKSVKPKESKAPKPALKSISSQPARKNKVVKPASPSPSPSPESNEEADREDESEDDEESVHIFGFSTDDDDSSDEEAMDEDEAPGIDVKKLPTIAKDDAVVKQKLEKAKRKPTADRGVIYVGRVPHGFYEDQMRSYFNQFGEVTRVRLSRNKRTGRSKHYAFVEFESSSVAQIVADTMDNYLLMGHILTCKVIPKDKVHSELWVGANRKWRQVPQGRVARVQHNKPRTEQEQKRAEKRLLKQQEQKKRKLAEVGIDYDFDVIAYKKRPKPTEAEA